MMVKGKDGKGKRKAFFFSEEDFDMVSSGLVRIHFRFTWAAFCKSNMQK